MAEIALARLPYVDLSQALSIGRDVLLHLSTAGVAHGAVSAWTVMVTDTGTAHLVGNLPGAHDPAADTRAAASLIASMTAEADPAVRRVLTAGAAGQYPDARSLLAALDAAAPSRHGAAWWSSAGLGAAVTAAVAGVASSHAATAGAVATGSGALPEVGRGLVGRAVHLPTRTWMIAAGAVVVVAGGVSAAVVANSGSDTPAHHVAVAPTEAAPTHPSAPSTASPTTTLPVAPVSTSPALAVSTQVPPVVGLSGRWTGTYSGVAGSGTFALRWAQTGDKLSGVIRISNPGVTLTISGAVHAGRISFGTLGGTPITYTGAVHGDRMSGTYQGQGFSGTWNARRA